MLDKINKISELEDFIVKKKKEIEPIEKQISGSFHQALLIKKELVEKYVEKSKWYNLNKTVDIDVFEVIAFKIVSVDWHDETECVVERPDGGQTSDFLPHSDIFDMFLESEYYQKLVREENLSSIIGNE